ncbi:MAG: TerB family tellurite resistance protein, partial [Planktomarina sp.]
APEPLTDHDMHIALAALMVRLARADHDYSDAEVAKIDATLATQFGLSPFDTAKLRGEAEVLEAEAPDTVRFTKALKDTVAYEDRFGLVKSLWTVVLADGERADEEDAQMRLIVNLLGINDRDSALARQAAG